jgi:hypothetical protein
LVGCIAAVAPSRQGERFTTKGTKDTKKFLRAFARRLFLRRLRDFVVKLFPGRLGALAVQLSLP